MSADFTPNMETYRNPHYFRFWCQKVLPLVYDDSLSYYELLCKVVNYLNDVIADSDAMKTNIGNLLTAYNELQEYVNNYFDSPDFQEKVNNKLDEMAENGTLMNLIAAFMPFVTPQMYGAKGDGLTDDTAALNECLRSNHFVFIPRGFYRITETIKPYCRDAVTVICDQKAIFIADGITGSMFEFSDFTGYSHIGASWTGGIFNMAGINGITAIKINEYCSFGTFRDIIIIDVGDNSTGIEVNITSGKNYFDNIRIFGASFNIDVTNPETNISIREYDLTRTNTGFYSKSSYDYAIGNIYIMGCTVGILTDGSAQVDVGQYHYWIGTDGTTNKITTSQFLKTRAIKALNTGDNWHFNMFYPDKPYIAAEINFISADNTHYICAPEAAISDPSQPYCYLAQMLDQYGSIKFNNCDVVTNNRIEFRGVYANAFAFRRGSVYIDNAYLQRFNYITPSLKINDMTENMPFTFQTGNNWQLIGYVCATIEGTCELQIFTPSNAYVIKADILVKDYNGYISGKSYQGSQTFNSYLGMGAPATINGLKWIPIYFNSDYSGGSTSFQLYIKATGTLPFFIAPGDMFAESVPFSYYIHTEKDATLRIYEVVSEQMNIPPGINTFSIPSPVIYEGYNVVSDAFIDAYVDTSNKCIVTIYRTVAGTVDIYNTTDETITGSVHLKALEVRKV